MQAITLRLLILRSISSPYNRVKVILLNLVCQRCIYLSVSRVFIRKSYLDAGQVQLAVSDQDITIMENVDAGLSNRRRLGH